MLSCYSKSYILALKRKCSVSNLKVVECLAFETCVANSSDVDIGSCECQTGFERLDDGPCVQVVTNGKAQEALISNLPDSSGSSHFAAAVLIPVLLVFFVIIIYVSYRYKVITWIRVKMNQRKANYDEVMIGQDLNDDDDPPLR